MTISFEAWILITLGIVCISAVGVRIFPRFLYPVYRLLLTLSLVSPANYFLYVYSEARSAHINNDFESTYRLPVTDVLTALLPALALCALLYIAAIVLVKRAPGWVVTLPFVLQLVNSNLAWEAINGLVERRGLYSGVLNDNGGIFHFFGFVIAFYLSLLLTIFFLIAFVFNKANIERWRIAERFER